ncbi:MAG: type II toxin-antitoxin system VapC family toxin [Dehalococcoidia bacterium]|nr:type II toxin-antitoxin system VapC family toxin [Dehalococcoidia bacterium]
MIVLDTNVVLEFMRDRPHQDVVVWLGSQARSTVFVTAITEAEIRTGVVLLPDGERRRRLASLVERAFLVLLAGRILPFDSDAARAYAVIAEARRASGRPISHPDCQIAAIARSRGASVATRDVDGFQGCGIDVIDPWVGV